jgi:hypothetical protein
VSIIVRRDLRSILGLARNQGVRPTCVAFAVSDAHAVARGAYETLSVEHLYFHAVQRTVNGHPARGVALPTALEALRLDGQCAEAGWPYLDLLPVDLTSWIPPSSATPIYRCTYSSVPPKINDIITQLDIGRPVVVTILLGERFYDPVGGIVVVGPGDANTDWHAIVAVGHGEDGANVFILVRNSWGSDWGMEGHAWISATYLEPRLYQLALIS